MSEFRLKGFAHSSMRIAFYTTSISAHQLPLARELAAKVGVENFRYIYTGKTQGGSQDVADNTSWITKEAEWVEDADVLLSGIRDVALFERRVRKGLLTIYSGERWFKPWKSILRLLVPAYFIMAMRFIALLESNDAFYCLPMGIYAVRDFSRLCGLLHGEWKCLFCAPELDFEREPGGKIWVKGNRAEMRFCLDKMRMWGYFVAPSTFQDKTPKSTISSPLTTIKVLWVGRMLKLKRVDTIIRAVGELSACSTCSTRFTLDIYGTGPEESRLKKLASKYGDVIKFYPPVPITDVRRLMREHDVYVLASNGYEGWGAVVSEALEEEMWVLGSKESGSASTMLPLENLFDANDWRSLYALLLKALEFGGHRNRIGAWCASNAAAKFLALVEQWRAKRDPHA